MKDMHRYLLVGGVTTATVLFGVYFIFWRKDEEDDENEFADLNVRENVASAVQTRVTVQVPGYCIGSFIGRGGENIKKFKAEYGVRFDFEKEEEKKAIEEITSDEKKEHKFRELIISGDREKVHRAEQAVKKFIEEVPEFVKTTMLVPQVTCGRIIGKGGKTIRELSSCSGAKITVDRNEDYTLGDNRLVRLSGTTVQVDYAKLLIAEKVDQEMEMRKKKEAEKQRKTLEEEVKKSSIQKYDDMSQVTLTIISSPIKVFVSAVDTPEHIWVQKIDVESKKLDPMIKDMTERYKRLPSVTRKLEIGEMCVAPFSQDEDMYRSSVLASTEQTVDLFYVDFGDTETVDIALVKHILDEDLTYPCQAAECSLAIQPKGAGSKWSADAVESFLKLVHCAEWQPMFLEVLPGTSSPTRVKLTEHNAKTVDVAQVMIENGFAEKIEERKSIFDVPKSNIKQKADVTVHDVIFLPEDDDSDVIYEDDDVMLGDVTVTGILE